MNTNSRHRRRGGIIRTAFGVTLVLVALLMFVGYMATDSTAPTSTGPSPVAQDDVEEEDRFANVIVFSANSLHNSYEANSIKADANFSNKLLAVKGVIDSIDTDILGSPYVLLKTEGMGVQCLFSKKHKHELVDLQKGQAVTIAGVGKGKTLGLIMLKECRLHEPSE